MPKLTKVLQALDERFELFDRECDDEFDEVVPICDLGLRRLSFLTGAAAVKHEEYVTGAPGGVVLVDRTAAACSQNLRYPKCATVVAVSDPRLVIARVLDYLQTEDEYAKGAAGVHPLAVVDHAAEIHPTAWVGPWCVIGRCEIGADSRIYPFSMVSPGARLGERVVVREHCTVGGHDLGFAMDSGVGWVRMPHVGRVVIEDDVEMFPFSVVNRATLGETRVRRGAKIGHHVLVGHNTEVGEHAMLTAGVVLCGSSKVGARSWVGVGATIKQGVVVGNDATVGIGAAVLDDVADGDIVVGVPAKPMKR